MKMKETNRNVIIEICLFLDARSVVNLGKCAKKYAKIVKSIELWRKKMYHDFKYKITDDMWNNSINVYRGLYMGSFIHYNNRPSYNKDITMDNSFMGKNFFKMIRNEFENFKTAGTLLWICKHFDYSQVVAMQNKDLKLDYVNEYKHPKKWKDWKHIMCYIPPTNTDKISKKWNQFCQQANTIKSELIDCPTYYHIKIGDLLTEIMDVSFYRRYDFEFL